ncbi:serine/threonine protein kinase [Saccharothrix sp. S26]|uniref:serine/threonine-protein kinase n=1 Tax=Saccharothrix sp. S26 TaxID=2907215 RepID=UPI001F32E866|nr:serine/threonine-protein kinase [Saccharothrix sp. S26]MCE6997316.1 serine/threonine protein kinase [Saccharothrix sp. S26]
MTGVPPPGGELVAGRYALVGPLGAGGMAEVHRAWDVDLRRPVAVKVFRLGDDVDAVRRFELEARTLAGLSHPGVVSLYDVGRHGGKPFMVLQLVEGPTLRARVERGALTVTEVRRVGAAVAESLAYVHHQGVVHRDLKPSNILLDRAGAPYLVDFGLARSAVASGLTRTGHVPGTAAYLAPEQVRGEEVGPAADVYALGLVLLECLTGRREYRGGQVDAAIARLHRPPTVPEDLPADLARLVRLMTSLTARRRPTARECAEALRTGARKVTAARPDAAATVPVSEAEPGPPNRRTP